MLATETITIEEFSYSVTQMPYPKARKLFVRLVNLLGPALEKTVKGKSILDMEAAAAIGALLGGLDEEDFIYISDTLAEHTMVRIGDKQLPLKQIQDTHFAGRFDHVFQWLLFALKVNYQSFLSSIGHVKPA